MPKLNLKPTLDEARTLCQRGNLIPIYVELPTDLDTPVSLFLRLAGDDPAFLLESVEGGERVARYSFLGVRMSEALVLNGNALRRHTLTDGKLEIVDWRSHSVHAPRDVLEQLREELSRYTFVELPDLPRFCGGLVGYTGYDVVRQFEKLPSTARPMLDVPDAVYFLADTLVAFDHVRHRLLIIACAHVTDDSPIEVAYESATARIKTIHARINAMMKSLSLDPQAECTAVKSNKSQPEFEALVREAKEYIASGDTFQIQISRRLKRRTTAHSFAIYRTLRRINPSPYMFYFDFGKLLPHSDKTPLRVIGASPELHARFEHGIATVRPIAGTRRRGYTPEEDIKMAQELINDPKERAEHVMLIDLGRNDIGRIAKFGTVKVTDLMVIENYSHVMHIVSSVQGEVMAGLDMFDVLRATFPAGTLTGAPKVRTMEIIEALEGERRHLYGGCAGYFSFNGQMDTCIIIRTIVMLGDMCYMQAAGGVVADSVPALEYKESSNKLRVVQAAIDEAENL
jgi:anthranilate synthase component 1